MHFVDLIRYCNNFFGNQFEKQLNRSILDLLSSLNETVDTMILGQVDHLKGIPAAIQPLLQSQIGSVYRKTQTNRLWLSYLDIVAVLHFVRKVSKKNDLGLSDDFLTQDYLSQFEGLQ